MPYLAKTFEIARNMPQTSSPLSNALKISRLIERSWLMQESPDLNPDCFGKRMLLSERIIKLQIRPSNIISHRGKSDTGQQFLTFHFPSFLWIRTALPSLHSEGNLGVFRHVFLWIRTALPFLHSEGNLRVFRHVLKITFRGLEIA